jgi:hypothetical protein
VIWFATWTAFHISILATLIKVGGLDGLGIFFNLISFAIYYEIFNAVRYPSITNTISVILNTGYYAVWGFVPFAIILNKLKSRRRMI